MEVNKYVVSAKDTVLVGQIFGCKVYQLAKVEFVCASEWEDERDQVYVEGLREMLENKCFYFSDSYDLTNSLQTFVHSGCSMKGRRKEYMFNEVWTREFQALSAEEWITPFISGFASLRLIHYKNSKCTEAILISRRSTGRQGVNVHSRGADLEGNTANTAETEMILQIEENRKREVFAYVQLRGLMPFLWKQAPTFDLDRGYTIHPDDTLNEEVMRKHFEKIRESYGKVTLINLIRRGRKESKLGEYYQSVNRKLEEFGFKYVWFDFHKECTEGSFANIARLENEIHNQLEDYGYFHLEIQDPLSPMAKVSRKSAQTGVFRTNCLGCIDRTNIAQYFIGRQVSLVWLRKLGFEGDEGFSSFGKLVFEEEDYDESFRLQWKNNGNIISTLYSGTPSLKSDLTKIGRMTLKGYLSDGKKLARRYVLENFYDHKQQVLIA